MAGEKNLDELLRRVAARLDQDVFVFANLSDRNRAAEIPAQMRFEEAEGTTLILREQDALEAGIDHDFRCRMITLEVHSSLEAVGFIACVASALAAENMGVNPVAGFFHDHLFVPAGREQDAMRIIAKISADARDAAR